VTNKKSFYNVDTSVLGKFCFRQWKSTDVVDNDADADVENDADDVDVDVVTVANVDAIGSNFVKKSGMKIFKNWEKLKLFGNRFNVSFVWGHSWTNLRAKPGPSFQL